MNGDAHGLVVVGLTVGGAAVSAVKYRQPSDNGVGALRSKWWHFHGFLTRCDY
jgi:hypothetical protein